MAFDLSTLYQNDDLDDKIQYQPFLRLKDPQPVRATCFNPSGEVFAIGSNTKTLRICRYPTEEELADARDQVFPEEPDVLFKFLQIHRGSVYCVAFNQAGNLLATGSNDQTVHLIKYNQKKHIPESSEYLLTTHNGIVRDLIFMKSCDGGETGTNILVSAGAGDNKIRLTDCNTMKSVQVLQGHESTVMSLSCWDDPNSFVSGSLDGTIRSWDVRSNRCISSIGKGKGDIDGAVHNSAPIGVVRVDESGKLLVSGYKNGNCMLYDLRGGRLVQLFKVHDDEIRTLNFSPKSYYLLTGSYDHKVRLIDLQGDLTNKLPNVLVAELDDRVVQTAWHTEDYNFVTTCADGTATLWTIPKVTN